MRGTRGRGLFGICLGGKGRNESITDGIESCAGAFIGMLNGKNFGKTMVRMSA